MEKAPPILEAYGQLHRFLAQATMEAVHAAVTQSWKKASMEISAAPDAGTCATKLRVVLESGGLLDVPLTKLVTDTAQEIWNLREHGVTPNFQSMTLTITSEGECTVQFAYAD